MKLNRFFVASFITAFGAASLLSSCKDSDEMTISEVETTTYEVEMNIASEATHNANSASPRRILKEESTGKVISEWEKGDKMIIFNVADGTSSNRTSYDFLTMLSSGKEAQANGTLNTSKGITSLAFLYPTAQEINPNVKTITPVLRKTGDGKKLPAIYYDEHTNITNLVELSMIEQDGKLETIGRKFDF